MKKNNRKQQTVTETETETETLNLCCDKQRMHLTSCFVPINL